MSGKHSQRNPYNVSGLSGLDSNHNGSMFLPEDMSGMEKMNILDARAGIDTYLERALVELDRISELGATTVILS